MLENEVFHFGIPDGLATIDVEMHVIVLDKRYGIIRECALPPVSHPAGVSIKARD